MTRQEAIERIKNDIEFNHNFLADEYITALEMAIQALKQEPCDDCISRKETIRWVKTECNPYGKPTLDFESGKKVIEHLEQMPSAEPKNCKFNGETDGMNCYECLKGMSDNFKALECEQNKKQERTMGIPMEDWLRGCVYHDGRNGEVTLPTDKVIEIANYIQVTRTGITDGMIYLPPYKKGKEK